MLNRCFSKTLSNLHYGSPGQNSSRKVMIYQNSQNEEATAKPSENKTILWIHLMCLQVFKYGPSSPIKDIFKYIYLFIIREWINHQIYAKTISQEGMRSYLDFMLLQHTCLKMNKQVYLFEKDLTFLEKERDLWHFIFPFLGWLFLVHFVTFSSCNLYNMSAVKTVNSSLTKIWHQSVPLVLEFSVCALRCKSVLFIINIENLEKVNSTVLSTTTISVRSD